MAVILSITVKESVLALLNFQTEHWTLVGFQNTEDKKSEQGCRNRGGIIDVSYCHLCANQSLADQTKGRKVICPCG